MTNKTDKIAELKAQYPTLRTGSDETGYVEMDVNEYEATISSWADFELAKAEEEAKIVNVKKAAEAKLAALGLTADELKALGL